MVAAEAGLAHHVLEGDVGGARHRGLERAAGRRCRDRAAASSSTPRLARSIISFWSRSSSTAKRAGTLASNGNCCSSRVHSAWMVCTFSPPGVSSAQANNSRARMRSFAVGWRDAGVADRCVERVVVERDPVAERGEHPLRHVGGGGLGEGDAEDLLRRHAVEQQPDHALHQHMGLAGAGIGGDEGRSRRVGRARLRGADGVGEWCGAPSPFLDPQSAGRRPFLDAREIVIGAVAVRPHRQIQRACRLGPRSRMCGSGSSSLLRARRRRRRRAAAAYRCCLIFSSSGSLLARRIVAAEPDIDQFADGRAGVEFRQSRPRAGSRLPASAAATAPCAPACRSAAARSCSRGWRSCRRGGARCGRRARTA